jgi:very-short-patch-repair endonuclease
VEPLPNRDFRRQLLFYEAAEGGAGVLRQLASDPEALARVARRALELCHFDPDSGADLEHAPGAREKCEAACYDCLMSYSNQSDHRLLDRHAITEVLQLLAAASVKVSPGSLPRAQQLELLLRACGSELEKRWLNEVETRGLNLPTHAQLGVNGAKARPDFTYLDRFTAVFIDGPPHDYGDVQARDAQAVVRLEDDGYTVIRFPHNEPWEPIFHANPSVFGGGG